MTSKAKVIVAVVVTGALSSGVWAFVMYSQTKTITEKFQGEISELTATLDALGPNVDCWTVSEEFANHVDGNTTGQIIEKNALEVISVPESLVGKTYVTDINQIVGKYFKVNVEPGTPLTSDLVMAEKYDDTLRDVDIICDNWVVGMRVGDYVDLDFTLPFGQDYVVLSHKRVQQIGAQTIKMYLTDEEWNIYQSAMVDHFLNKSNGTRLYLKKYIEPGVQEAATPFYSPSDAVRTMMLADPNIVSKAETRLLASFRPGIDSELNQFIDDQTTLKTQSSLISGGWSSYVGNVNTDYNTSAQAEDSSDEDTYQSDGTDVVLEEQEDGSTETEAPDVETEAEQDLSSEEEDGDVVG